MIQEALTNSLKHADATMARICLTYLPLAVELEVTDNGRAAAGSGEGHGLVGMRERAAVFGGEVSAGPCLAGGWRVHTLLHLGPVSARPPVAAAPVASGAVAATDGSVDSRGASESTSGRTDGRECA